MLKYIICQSCFATMGSTRHSPITTARTIRRSVKISRSCPRWEIKKPRASRHTIPAKANWARLKPTIAVVTRVFRVRNSMAISAAAISTSPQGFRK